MIAYPWRGPSPSDSSTCSAAVLSAGVSPAIMGRLRLPDDEASPQDGEGARRRESAEDGALRDAEHPEMAAHTRHGLARDVQGEGDTGTAQAPFAAHQGIVLDGRAEERQQQGAAQRGAQT